MKIEVAKAAGFCFGVKRSVKLVNEALDKEGKAYLYGMPVHNPKVVADVQKKGGILVEDNAFVQSKLKDEKYLKSMDDIPNHSTVLMRAHGVPPSAYEKAKEKGLKMIDTTCPFVTMVHKQAKELEDQGYQVVIVGERGHPEVMGILGSAPKALIVENAQEARELFKDKKKYFKYTSNDELMKESEDENIVEKLYYPVIPKIGLVSQTTQSNDNVVAIAKELSSKARELRVYNTICNAMHEMQPSAVELSTRVDGMVVIGGRSSGNTRRLQELCSEQTESHWIEGVSEMKEDWFKGKKHVGIAAGASTPDEDIQQCVEWLKQFDQRVNNSTSEVIIPAYVVH